MYIRGLCDGLFNHRIHFDRLFLKIISNIRLSSARTIPLASEVFCLNLHIHQMVEVPSHEVAKGS
ncbi:unnamed protein product [Phytomonas sp. EM1]|nr:unnamed protein product [Phytomonas sp. EM1]|eukprot:CCW60824.1 unnamed protein product [Phytomonas sp. isolate EM1]